MEWVQKSLICAVGQDHEESTIEYFADGGVLELKSSKTYKKTIDFFAGENGSVSISARYKEKYSFTDLALRSMDIEFFHVADQGGIHSYADILSWCVNVLAASPCARQMVREAIEKNWCIALDDLHGGEYCIDVERKLLLLDNNALIPSALGRSNYFRNLMLVTLSKALRDIWQEKRHGGLDEIYRADYLLLMERIRAADCDVLSILIGWELRSEGYPELWRHLIGSENGDMAMIFSNHLERSPSGHFDNSALFQTFKQWFSSQSRVNACDHDILEYMDDILGSSQTHNPFGRKKPGKINIEVLSCLPDKTAYLQGLGQEILSNPLYSAMDDVINQTHLFHILYDLEATIVQNVPFRSQDLARKIFPEDFFISSVQDQII